MFGPNALVAAGIPDVNSVENLERGATGSVTQGKTPVIKLETPMRLILIDLNSSCPLELPGSTLLFAPTRKEPL